jgi:hypothetical protein
MKQRLDPEYEHAGHLHAEFVEYALTPHSTAYSDHIYPIELELEQAF